MATSASVRFSVAAATRARPISAPWVRTTPLAGPVVPEVKNRKAASWPAAARGLGLRGIALRSGEFPALLQERVVAHKLGPVIVAHAPVLVVDDAANRRASGQDLEQLVDLLLVLGEDVGDLGALNRSRHLVGRRILVKRHGDGAQPVRRTHRGIEAWPVVTHEGDMRAALQRRAPTVRPPARLPRQPVRAMSRCARCRAFFPAAPDARRAPWNGEAAALEKYPALLFQSPSVRVSEALQHDDLPLI